MDTSDHAAQEPPIPLWSSPTPGALGDQPHDTPAITPYMPPASTGAVMVVCPGGGYARHAPHEGHDYALWLNTLGIAAFVLRYRLGADGYRHPRMLEDAARVEAGEQRRGEVAAPMPTTQSSGSRLGRTWASCATR
jgi:acetyl esterase/lipase